MLVMVVLSSSRERLTESHTKIVNITIVSDINVPVPIVLKHKKLVQVFMGI
jgi:hypothetical protein